MSETHTLRDVRVQLISTGSLSTDSNALEFSDENGDAFMEITMEDSGEHQICIHSTKKHLVLPLSALVKGIEVARAQVRLFPLHET